MKLACCDKCHDVFKLTFRLKHCKCKNISAKHVDAVKAVVYRKDRDTCRILGVENSIRYGYHERGEVWIQHPGDPNTGANLEEVECF